MANWKKLLRYDLPLHMVLRLSNWWPDNVFFIRLRGRLAAPFFKSCGKRLGLARNISFYNPSHIEIGEDVYIAYGCWFNGTGGISIGDQVLFGPYVVVVSSNHSKEGDSYRFGPSKLAPIEIRKGTWIAAHVTIIAGSVVGEGVLVAANAVVNGTLKDHIKAGGIPARELVSNT